VGLLSGGRNGGGGDGANRSAAAIVGRNAGGLIGKTGFEQGTIEQIAAAVAA